MLLINFDETYETPCQSRVYAQDETFPETGLAILYISGLIKKHNTIL